MRVLMTADGIGGVWNYALELARGLARCGSTTVLAVMGGRLRHDQRAVAARIPGLILHDRDLALEWMPDPWDDVRRASRWLLRLARQMKPDVIHLNGYAHGALAWPCPTVVVGHSCVLSWWREVEGEDAPAEWDRYRATVARGLAGADAVVAPTEAMAAALRHHYGRSARVIHNGRSPRDFPPAGKLPLVLAAGRLWDRAKNVEALARVADDLPWPVYVAGSSRSPWGRTASTGSLRMLGHISPEELSDWYGRAAVFAAPARYEPFGLTVLEAALAGCALVLGDIPSLRELWNGAAVFVAPDDHEALRSALRELLYDPRRRRRLVARSRARALRFGSAEMAERYLFLYRTTLAHPRSARTRRDRRRIAAATLDLARTGSGQ